MACRLGSSCRFTSGLIPTATKGSIRGLPRSRGPIRSDQLGRVTCLIRQLNAVERRDPLDHEFAIAGMLQRCRRRQRAANEEALLGPEPLVGERRLHAEGHPCIQRLFKERPGRIVHARVVERVRAADRLVRRPAGRIQCQQNAGLTDPRTRGDAGRRTRVRSSGC